MPSAARAYLTKELRGDDHRARVRELFGIEVNWLPGGQGWEMKEMPGTEFVLPADLVLIAMGFLHVVRAGLVEELGVKIDGRGNVAVDNWMSSVPGVFAAGDTVARGVVGGSRHQSGPHHGRRCGQVAAEVKDCDSAPSPFSGGVG